MGEMGWFVYSFLSTINFLFIKKKTGISCLWDPTLYKLDFLDRDPTLTKSQNMHHMHDEQL